MRIGPIPTQIRELPGLDQAGPASKIADAAKAAPSFSTGAAKPAANPISSAVADVNAKMQTADTETTKLLTGESTNVHQAVIAMQEAGVAFSLMVEVRNKLVDSYQELMRMQV